MCSQNFLSLAATTFISDAYWFGNISPLVRGTSETIFFEISLYFIYLHSRYLYIRKELFRLFLLQAMWKRIISFGPWGIKLFLFHLFGIDVLPQFSFPLIPLLSSWMHIASEISLDFFGEQVKHYCFSEISPYFIFFYSRDLNIRKELSRLFLLQAMW